MTAVSGRGLQFREGCLEKVLMVEMHDGCGMCVLEMSVMVSAKNIFVLESIVLVRSFCVNVSEGVLHLFLEYSCIYISRTETSDQSLSHLNFKTDLQIICMFFYQMVAGQSNSYN